MSSLTQLVVEDYIHTFKMKHVAHNSLILKLWVKSKIDKLEYSLRVCITERDRDIIRAKKDVLMEFFDDFNLESVDEKEVIIHNNF